MLGFLAGHEGHSEGMAVSNETVVEPSTALDVPKAIVGRAAGYTKQSGSLRLDAG